MAAETDDEFLVRRMREMKPLDSSGMTVKSIQGVKEMGGQTGGGGSYSIPPSPVQPVPNPDVSQPSAPLPTVPNIIISLNGTLEYFILNATDQGPV